MSNELELLSSLPERIPFSKFSGSGNDFIVIDNRPGTFSEVVGLLARRICARRYSVGADGLILIENSNKASFRVRFYNPDGKEFSTCGNGGRCAARFAWLNVICGRKMTMETNVGVLDAEVVGNNVKIKFVPPQKIQLFKTVRINDKQIQGHWVHLGDPHFVVYAKDLARHDIVPGARKLRYHEAFQPEGTNVHFIEPISRSSLKIRSYERGVENETLACGSGCVSAAIATFLTKQSEPPITFEPKSRIPLTVHFQEGNNFLDLYLEGDARLIYRGDLTREGLLGFPTE